MPKSNVINQPQNYAFAAKAFTSTDGTASTLIATPGVNDGVVKALVITSTDTAARTLEILINNGTSDFLLETLAIPAASGTDGVTPPVDALSSAWLPSDRAAKRVLPIPTGCTLHARCQSAVTAGKAVTISGIIENF